MHCSRPKQWQAAHRISDGQYMRKLLAAAGYTRCCARAHCHLSSVPLRYARTYAAVDATVVTPVAAPSAHSASSGGQPYHARITHPATSPSCSTVLALLTSSGRTNGAGGAEAAAAPGAGAAPSAPPGPAWAPAPARAGWMRKNSDQPRARQPSARYRCTKAPPTSRASRPRIRPASHGGSAPWGAHVERALSQRAEAALYAGPRAQRGWLARSARLAAPTAACGTKGSKLFLPVATRPGGQARLVCERRHGAADEHLVGGGVQVGPHHAGLAPALGDVAVGPVTDARDRQHAQCRPVVALQDEPRHACARAAARIGGHASAAAVPLFTSARARALVPDSRRTARTAGQAERCHQSSLCCWRQIRRGLPLPACHCQRGWVQRAPWPGRARACLAL